MKLVFRYLQIQSFLNSQKDTGFCYQLFPLEIIITAGEKRGILGLGYQALTTQQRLD